MSAIKRMLDEQMEKGTGFFPEEDLKKIHDDYMKACEALRRDYIDEAGMCIATWFIDNNTTGGEYGYPEYLYAPEDTEDIILGGLVELFGPDAAEVPYDEITAAALLEIEIECTPQYPEPDPEDLQGYGITTVDLEQEDSGGYAGADTWIARAPSSSGTTSPGAP